MAYFVHTTIFLFCFRISLFAKLIVLRDNFVEGHRELQQHTSLPCPVYYTICVPLFWMTLQKIT